MEDKDVHDVFQKLMDDPSFVRWIKSDFKEHNEQWKSYFTSHPEHHSVIDDARAVLIPLRDLDSTSFDTSKVWNRIHDSIMADVTDHSENKKSRVVNLRYIIPAIAAILIAGLFYLNPFSSHSISKVTGNSEQLTVTLPDGSSVLMDAKSQIDFDKNKWKNDRKVHLEGLAFFNVQKGSKFTVVTPQGEVTVMGTSFSVYARKDKFEVFCKTGKVSVLSYNSDNESQILTPNDKVIFSEGAKTFVPSKENDDASVAWMDGTYTFLNQPLSTVFLELERQFDVKIVADENINAMAYTGFFKRDNMQEALTYVTWPLGLQFSIEKQTVKIYK
ncbi:MAG: FecR domain-containing protein [Lewinellaceae bacterium]|nr:FecR domain-containing protein [Lewinellaceae bacterium]